MNGDHQASRDQDAGWNVEDRFGSLAGLVCDPSDVGSIASTLSDVVTNEKLRRDLVAKAGMLKREFDPMRMGRAYAFLLTSRRAARRYCRAAAT